MVPAFCYACICSAGENEWEWPQDCTGRWSNFPPRDKASLKDFRISFKASSTQHSSCKFCSSKIMPEVSCHSRAAHCCNVTLFKCRNIVSHVCLLAMQKYETWQRCEHVLVMVGLLARTMPFGTLEFPLYLRPRDILLKMWKMNSRPKYVNHSQSNAAPHSGPRIGWKGWTGGRWNGGNEFNCKFFPITTGKSCPENCLANEASVEIK